MEEEVKDFRVLFVYPNETIVGVVPSNLAILSAHLKKVGFQTKLFDTSIYKTKEETQDDLRVKLKHVKPTDMDKYTKYRYEDVHESFVKTVEEYKPNLIAVNVVDSTVSYAISFLEKIRHLKIPTILGGIAATFMTQKILENDAIDMVCVGEGDETLVELCERMYKGQEYKDVRNLCFRDGNGGVIRNSLRPLVDLDTLPYPDFSIFEDFRIFRPFRGRVVRMAQIDLDRGCPYACTYCAAPNLRRLYNQENVGCYFRKKSIGKSIEEIKYLVKRYNLNFLWISSETFLIRKKDELEEFAKRYIEEVNLPFWCQTRLDSFTEENTELLHKMGCQAISVGLEHGDQKIRNEILKKNLSDEQILNTIKLISKYKIFLTVNSMIGLPDETREDIFKTIELNRKISSMLDGNHSLNVFIFAPFSGTPLRQVCLDKGYLSEDTENLFSFYEGSLLTMPSISKEEIKGLAKTIPFYIKLPKTVYPQIKVAEKDDEEGKRMFENLSALYSKDEKETYEINRKLLRKAKEKGFCLCDAEKAEDGSNICPCEDFLDKGKCKCGVFTSSLVVSQEKEGKKDENISPAIKNYKIAFNGEDCISCENCFSYGSEYFTKRGDGKAECIKEKIEEKDFFNFL